MDDRRRQLCALFKEMLELTVLDEQNPQSFRSRAYEMAELAIRSLTGDIETMTVTELSKVSGIGKSSAQKIKEWVETGKIAKLEKLRDKHPPAIVELSRLPGVGPKTVAKLRSELNVQSVDDLRQAIADQRLRSLSGFGPKSEEKIAQALKQLGMDKRIRRTPVARALRVADQIVAAVRALPQVDHAEYCGSLRRLQETIGDLDIVVASSDPKAVMATVVELPVVDTVIVSGDTKTSFRTREGLQVDVRVVAPHQLGAALMYFTGSKAHNIKLRQRALDRGLTLNEYALTRVEDGTVLASESEDAIYAALEMELVPPTMREDRGEVEAAAKRELPSIPTVETMLGDLHVHTERSGDGHDPLDLIAKAAIERGYEYLALTDHAENLARVGIGREELKAQREEMDRLSDTLGGFRLLQGVELNIGPEGELDYDPEFRLGLDFCVAAIHSHFDLPQAAQTKRLIAAMQDPAVNVIGHITGRMIGRRPGVDFDVDAVLDAAVETRTAIEVNGAPGRLDAPEDLIRRALDRDITFVLSSDAHRISELSQMRFGTLQAQRGWLDRRRIANTWKQAKFLDWVSAKRNLAS